MTQYEMQQQSFINKQPEFCWIKLINKKAPKKKLHLLPKTNKLV